GSSAKSAFLVFLTLYKYHEKYGQFPQILDEGSRDKLMENLKALESELLEELKNGDSSLSNCTTPEGWYSKIFGQFTFTSSIVGGFLAQDVIRAVTKDTVKNNCFIFDGLRGFNVDVGF